MSSLEKMQPEYEFDQNPYESFMRRHLQHYGYYTGRNQGFRNSFKPYDEWEKTHGYEVSSSSGESYSDMEDDDDEDFANKQEKLQEELSRSTQVVFNYEAGKMVAKLREPRNLYALNTEIGPQQAARWPDFIQVLDERVRHIYYKPPLPEPFYQSHGSERMPMVRGKENGGRVVFNYELHIPRLMRYRVGGTREGCEQCSVMLTSPDDTTLLFESRFESGNMSRAVQVSEFEYELTLRYDLFTNKHTQWFYFRLRNTRANTSYRFTIVNFMKPDSLYNSGMKPVMYSQREADKRRIGWIRAGQNIKYYRNNRVYSSRQGDKPYYSLTWTVQFPHDNDTVYIAHCYPYTYCDLQDYLMDLSNDPVKSCICKQRVLCRTQAGNLVYVLTITSSSQNPQDVKYKKAIVLTSRVHPGESNASWMMKGFLDYLTSNAPDAKLLRDTFIFKIVPMLNPDGVIVGNYRCSLTGRDLNRNYRSALKTSFPSVWYTRNMIKRLVEEREVMIYCDLHGHSRKQNVFIYGCDNHDNPDKRLKERVFPAMMAKNASDKFKYEGCKFKVQKSKESTGRVVMWRMGIMNSYTMEATFCGSTLNKMKGYHFSPADFESLGYHFCDTLLDYCDPDPTKFGNIFLELEERMKQDIMTKLEKQGLQPSEIDLNEAYTSGMESSDGGSDSSVSDGLPVNIQFPPQSTKKKKVPTATLR